MTALDDASRFVSELENRRIPYYLLIARPEAIMIAVTIPGERWEIEFFDDLHVELERFVSVGVDDREYRLTEIVARVLAYYGNEA